MTKSEVVMTIPTRTDFSSFYIRLSPSPTALKLTIYDGTPRVEWHSASDLWVSTCRQHALLPIQVEVLDGDPGEPDDSWDDVSEISLLAAKRVSVTGWLAEWSSQDVPLRRGHWYRMRYSLANTGRASSVWEPPYPEIYRLQFWEAEPTLAEEVR